jgi:hypothetical protein
VNVVLVGVPWIVLRMPAAFITSANPWIVDVLFAKLELPAAARERT